MTEFFLKAMLTGHLLFPPSVSALERKISQYVYFRFFLKETLFFCFVDNQKAADSWNAFQKLDDCIG
jgi:hypothetical protein